MHAQRGGLGRIEGVRAHHRVVGGIGKGSGELTAAAVMMGQADGDIKDILTRAGRIVSRADKIDKVELSTPEAGKALPAK